jgi:hypothetical protein
VMRRIVGPAPERATPDHYERILEPSYAWLHAMAQHARDEGGVAAGNTGARVWRRLSAGSGHRPVSSWFLRAGFGLSIATLNRAGMGPLRSELSATELRRAGLRAIGEAARRLGVTADHVLFGHTHRSGPWPRDAAAEWRAPTGARLWNTGTWVYEDHFVTDVPGESPYWPGAAILLEDAGDPQPRRLLGDRARGELKAAPA